MTRAALFTLVAMLFFVHWQVADPSYDAPAFQSSWNYVLLFSAAILGLAFAVPAFAGLLGGQGAFRASLVVAAGAVLSSFSNILEDGLQMKWAFFAFVLGSAIIGAGLLALTAVTAFRRGGQRILALVPAGNDRRDRPLRGRRRHDHARHVVRSGCSRSASTRARR